MDHKGVIIYSGILFLFINIIVFFKSYRSNSLAIKFFSFYLILTFLIQVLNSYYFKTKRNNLYLSHYYFIGQFILLSLFFKQLLKSVYKKTITAGLYIVLITLGIYYAIPIQLV